MQQTVKAIKESTYNEKTYWWVELRDGKRLMEVTTPAYSEGDTLNFEPTLWAFMDKGKGKSYYRRKQATEETPYPHLTGTPVGTDDRSADIRKQCGMKVLGRLLCADKLDKHPELQKRLLVWLEEVTQ